MASTPHPHQTSAHATGARGPEKRSSALGGPSAAALEVFPVPGCSSARAGISYLWSFAGWNAPQVRPEVLTQLHLWMCGQWLFLHFPALYRRQSSVPSRRVSALLVPELPAPAPPGLPGLVLSVAFVLAPGLPGVPLPSPLVSRCWCPPAVVVSHMASRVMNTEWTISPRGARCVAKPTRAILYSAVVAHERIQGALHDLCAVRALGLSCGGVDSQLAARDGVGDEQCEETLEVVTHTWCKLLVLGLVVDDLHAISELGALANSPLLLGLRAGLERIAHAEHTLVELTNDAGDCGVARHHLRGP
eukprot:3040390-Heterocapsa_arctica.AAC.1